MLDNLRSPMPGTASSPTASPSSAGAAPRSRPSAWKTKTLASTLSTSTNGRPRLSPGIRRSSQRSAWHPPMGVPVQSWPACCEAAHPPGPGQLGDAWPARQRTPGDSRHRPPPAREEGRRREWPERGVSCSWMPQGSLRHTTKPSARPGRSSPFPKAWKPPIPPDTSGGRLQTCFSCGPAWAEGRAPHKQVSQWAPTRAAAGAAAQGARW